jgi:hypothetical protein
MLYFFSGTDSDTLRAKLGAAVEKTAGKSTIVRITDAHAIADLMAALSGGGMFAERRVVVFDQVLTNLEMRDALLGRMPEIASADEHYFIVELAPDAATRKQIEKHAKKSERFDARKSAKKESIFRLANALQRGDKKALWVGYQEELAAGKAPEAIHGVLFWAAKQHLLRSDTQKARALVAALAELPHEARRAGFDLEYALEHFVLARV